MRVKLFIIHSNVVSVRKPAMEKLISKLKQHKKLKVDAEFVMEHEPNSLNIDIVRPFLNLEKDPDHPEYDPMVKNLHVRYVSNALKHMTALQKASSVDKKYDWFVIVEDDVLHGDEIDKDLYKVFRQASGHDYDLIFLGQPVTKEMPKADDIIFRSALEQFKILPCCESYAIPSSSVKKIADKFGPIKFQTNVQFSYMIDTKRDDIKAVSTWPNYMFDGSKYGVYLSSLEANNRLILNSHYNVLFKKIVTDPELDVEGVDKLWSEVQLKNNPDLNYLKGLFEYKKKNFAEAKRIFADVYDVYSKNNNLLSNESEFLYNYINMHKFIQPDLPVLTV